jgi:hypothetical protein
MFIPRHIHPIPVIEGITVNLRGSKKSNCTIPIRKHSQSHEDSQIVVLAFLVLQAIPSFPMEAKPGRTHTGIMKLPQYQMSPIQSTILYKLKGITTYGRHQTAPNEKPH